MGGRRNHAAVFLVTQPEGVNVPPQAGRVKHVVGDVYRESQFSLRLIHSRRYTCRRVGHRCQVPGFWCQGIQRGSEVGSWESMFFPIPESPVPSCLARPLAPDT